ncbi:hypothetical protein C8R44DRAFT_892199 [Mycena epipterygia]|nr:hypothetical protein C8R44DRAFT_892199 [Mycena epipterygia]
MSQFTVTHASSRPTVTTSQQSLYGKSRARLQELLAYNVTLHEKQAQVIREYNPAENPVDLITMKGLLFILKLRITHIEGALQYLADHNVDVVPTPSGEMAADEDAGFWPPETEGFWDAVGSMPDGFETA